MDIRVCKHGRVGQEPLYTFYVGRSQMGRYYGDRSLNALGNPFPMWAGMSRAESITHYRVWLWGKLDEHDPDVLSAIGILEAAYRQHGMLRLVCHCAPLPCHADMIKACLEWRAKQQLTAA